MEPLNKIGQPLYTETVSAEVKRECFSLPALRQKSRNDLGANIDAFSV
jgi:hypothetical protein